MAKIRELISMSHPDISEEDIQEVSEVLRSGRLALGPKAKEFESLIAAYANVKHAIAVSSGTAALHLIIKALGISPKDEVLVPSFTFAASVNAIFYVGAIPIFVDINPKTYTIDLNDLKKKINFKTKAIMVVDIFGHPAEWNEIMSIADQYGLKIIDDACEALGAEYRNKKLGSFGDAAAFAFYPNKQITTGEGGIITTNNNEIAKLCQSMRNQGRGEMGSWLEHDRLGFNYRLDEMSAALGVSQFKRIEKLLAKRAHVASIYNEMLARMDGICIPAALPYVKISWFVYVIKLINGLERSPVMKALFEKGIPSRAYFSPVHLQPYIRQMLGTKEGMLPVTESICNQTLALPFHANLTEKEIQLVVESLVQCISTLKVNKR